MSICFSLCAPFLIAALGPAHQVGLSWRILWSRLRVGEVLTRDRDKKTGAAPRQQGDFLSFTVHLALGRQSPLHRKPFTPSWCLRIHREDLPDSMALNLLPTCSLLPH